MMPVPLAAWLVAGAGLYLATFTVLATLFFLVGTGLLGAFAHPFWQWWLYALWYSGNPVVRAWLEVSGVPAAILPLVAAGSIWYRRRRVRGWTLRANPRPRAPGGAADPRHNRQLRPCPLGADGGGAGPVAGAEPVPGSGSGQAPDHCPGQALAGSWSARLMIRGRRAGHSARAIRRHGARAGGRRCWSIPASRGPPIRLSSRAPARSRRRVRSRPC